MTQNTEKDLIIRVFPWKIFMCAWAQKQLSTLTSAKTWVTACIIFLSYQLTVTKHTYQVLIDGKVLEVTAPYLTGSDWAGMIQGILVAYLGARVLQPTVRTVGDKWASVVRERNGKSYTAPEHGRISVDEDE